MTLARLRGAKVKVKPHAEQLIPLSVTLRTIPQLQFLGFGIRMTLFCRVTFRFSLNLITFCTSGSALFIEATHSCALK
jgi:hypothetical protein